MASDILEGLNPNQREAVETIEGPLLIIAGPGSGKTRVITHRIAYLVRVCGVTPYRIAAVTFTNKAAREMRERLVPLLGKGDQDLNVGTFHSFCAMILRREGDHIGLDRNFTIYDDDDQISLIKRSMGEIGVDPKSFAPRAVLSAISRAKSQLITAEGFALKRENYFDEVVHRVYERYDALLAQSSAVDFDDILLKTYQLFESVPQVSSKYQDRFVHFMIDEFQDTNVVQYAIAKQLSEGYRNICVVGDPDQSIYAWRNADIRNILSFQHDYPEAKVITLDENYRSSQTILDTAEQVISSNRQRVKKELWTQNGKGVPIVVHEGYNEEEEAQFVVKEVQNLAREASLDLGDMAVMYRVNAQSRALEEACLRYGLPYQLVGSIRFYQRQEIKDLAAYLRVMANPTDDVSLARIINVPTRGIGQRTVDDLTRYARDSGCSMFAAIQALAGDEDKRSESPFPTRSAQVLMNFHNLMEGLAEQSQTLDLVELIDVVLERTGYKRHLLEEDDRGEERWENLQELRSLARDYVYLGMREGLTAFLEHISLVSDIDRYENKVDAVTLITLHQAKGLEFPVVFIVGLEEGILPHVRSMDDLEELEEERRLLYVGVTRAKDRVYLVRAFRRGFRGGGEPGLPSRFLSDIPQELMVAAKAPSRKVRTSPGWTHRGRKPTTVAVGSESKHGTTDEAPAAMEVQLTTGDKVRHSIFGEGMVISCKPAHGDVEVTVAFDDGQGIKRLLLSLAPLEKLG